MPIPLDAIWVKFEGQGRSLKVRVTIGKQELSNC